MGLLFEESHKELLNLVKWISQPIIYSPHGALDDEQLRRVKHGEIIIGYNRVGEALEVIHSLPKDDTSLILKTFCASHLRLK